MIDSHLNMDKATNSTAIRDIKIMAITAILPTQ